MSEYISNINSVVLDIRKSLDGLLEKNNVVKEIATSILGSNLRRIHTEGKAVDGSKIGGGKYSTKSIYVNPNKSPKTFTPMGKVGSKFKSGKPHKTRYFKDGYKGFRAKIGRDVSVVNLSLFGNLAKEFILQANGKDYELGFASQEASDKGNGNEKKYGQVIWGVSKQDNKNIEALLKNAKPK